MEAVMAEIGLDPDEVGEMVIDAIARQVLGIDAPSLD